MNKVKWEALSEDKLSRVSWSFYLSVSFSGELKIQVDEYREDHRESTRHRNWIVDKIYTRIGDTRCYLKSKLLSKDDINEKLNDDIITRAIECTLYHSEVCV